MGKSMNVDYLNPKSGQEIVHAIRYYVARAFVEPGDIVLDLGAGTGYGSHMLSKVAKEVFAYDIEKDFVKRADNINFTQADLENFVIPKAHIAVALEFLEHTKNPKDMTGKIKEKTINFIILSYPQKPTAGLDPTHLSNLKKDEVKTWIEDKSWRCIFEHSFGLSILQVFKHYDQ